MSERGTNWTDAQDATAVYNAGWELRGTTLSERVESFFSFRAQPVRLYGQLLQELAAMDQNLADEFRQLNAGHRSPAGEARLVSRIADAEARAK